MNIQMFNTKVVAVFCIVIFTSGCTTLNNNIIPVNDFEADRYAGKWFEIARLDNRFEHGMNNVSAEYIIQQDSIKVINRGFDVSQSHWQQSTGIALLVSESDVGHFKVSFFRPFYGSYVIFELDKQGYQYAFVAGSDLEYLWLLARTPTVNNSLKQKFMRDSQALGFDTSKLVWVEHTINKNSENQKEISDD